MTSHCLSRELGRFARLAAQVTPVRITDLKFSCFKSPVAVKSGLFDTDGNHICDLNSKSASNITEVDNHDASSFLSYRIITYLLSSTGKT
jgi:hypothetical protein